MGSHVHAVENTFDDWDKQFLLPDALSEDGPGVARTNIDRDGAEDLIVGTGKGGKIAVFRNAGGKLVPMPGGLTASADMSTWA